ncbi:MAG: OmpA family protein, partial [Bacteroidota bacterium]|nr:OmpA family protein [Bacteroidota bacterium]
MNKLISIFIIVLFNITAFSQTELIFNEFVFKQFEKEKNISSPSISFDGKYLIFVITNKDGYTFYESKDSLGTWTQPVALNSINDAMDVKTYKNCPVYNYDASQIYFEALNVDNIDIYTSSRTDTGWTVPVSLPKPINTIMDEAEPSISANDNSIFFVRFYDPKERECGKIFSSVRKKDRTWSEPVLLVDPINLECERSPRILSDNKTLLFASMREKDKDFKIYYTFNINADFWLIPKPISLFEKNDYLYPSMDYKAQKLYVTEVFNKRKSAVSYADMPQKFAPRKTKIIRGQIKNNNGKPINGKIYLLDPISIEKKAIYTNNLDSGKYQFFIHPNSKYILDYSAPGYSHKFIDYSANKSSDIIDIINVTLFDTVEVKLNIFDKDIYEPLDVEINTINVETDDTLKLWSQRERKGKYTIKLPIGYNYNIALTGKYTKPYNLAIDLSGVVIFDSFEKNAEVISETVAYTFKVIDNQTSDGILCDINLTNLNTSKKVKLKAKTNANGEIVIYVRKGDMYDVTINPQGYAFYSTDFSVNSDEKKKIEVKLQPLKKDTKIKFANITFETNSADLNVESYHELDRIIDLLEKNPVINVEISAHTDNVGSDIYNLKLSEKRANSVVDYLIENNTDPNRL